MAVTEGQRVGLATLCTARERASLDTEGVLRAGRFRGSLAQTVSRSPSPRHADAPASRWTARHAARQAFTPKALAVTGHTSVRPNWPSKPGQAWANQRAPLRRPTHSRDITPPYLTPSRSTAFAHSRDQRSHPVAGTLTRVRCCLERAVLVLGAVIAVRPGWAGPRSRRHSQQSEDLILR